MLPLVWAQTKATGRGRPNGAAAIEAYNVARRAHKERLAALAAAGVEDGAFYAEAGADLPMDMAPATGALEPVAGTSAPCDSTSSCSRSSSGRADVRGPPVYMSDGDASDDEVVVMVRCDTTVVQSTVELVGRSGCETAAVAAHDDD